MAGAKMSDKSWLPNFAIREQNPSIAPGVVIASTECNGTVLCPLALTASDVAALGARPDPLRLMTLDVGPC